MIMSVVWTAESITIVMRPYSSSLKGNGQTFLIVPRRLACFGSAGLNLDFLLPGRIEKHTYCSIPMYPDSQGSLRRILN